MLNIICFSKDRPLQLDGYIRSILRYFKIEYTLYVIYVSSNPIIEKQYIKLKKENKHVYFIKEVNINKNIIELIDSFYINDFIMFGCDDVIFTSEVDGDYINFFNDKRFFCFSLRLGDNIMYCHPANKFEYFVGQNIQNKFLVCNWTEQQHNIDFGYPFELNATIYRLNDVKKYLKQISDIKWHPNLLEGNFYGEHKKLFYDKPLMAFYKTSKAYVITVNMVQNIIHNRIYNEISVEEMAVLFDDNKRINLDYYSNIIYNSIHIGDFKVK